MSKFITKNQLTGDTGEYLAGYVLSSVLNIIYRPISIRDTGVDAEIELTEEAGDSKYCATGIFIKTQVKSSVSKSFDKGKLTINLSERDKEYFTSEMNLPGVLLFADLREGNHNLYWAEIIPKSIQENSNVTIEEKNLITTNTIEDFTKISEYYKSISFRNELISILDMTADSAIDMIEKSKDEQSAIYVLNKFIEEIVSIRNVYDISFVRNMKKQNIPHYDNIFDNTLGFAKQVTAHKQRIEELNKAKGYNLDLSALD